MTTATHITIPSTPTILESMIQHWKRSVAEPAEPMRCAARPLSASEIAAFLNAASHDENRVLGVLLTCTLLSGISPYELAAAEWDQYDADSGKIEVCDEQADHYATYQLPKLALDMIHAAGLCRTDVPWVFHYGDEQVDEDEIFDAFHRIAMDAGILDLSLAELMMVHEQVVLFAALFDVPLTLPPAAPNEPFDDFDDFEGLCF